MATETQKEFVARLLRERGAAGVGAHELTYQHGITRAASIIHELRHVEHWNIETRQEQGHQATYILHGDRSTKLKSAPEARVTGADAAANLPGPPPLPAYDLDPIGWTELGEKWKAERADRFVGRNGDTVRRTP